MTLINLISLGIGLARVLQIVILWQIFRHEDDDHWDL